MDNYFSFFNRLGCRKYDNKSYLPITFLGDPIQPVLSSSKKAKKGIMGWHNGHTVRYKKYCLLSVSVNRYYCTQNQKQQLANRKICHKACCCYYCGKSGSNLFICQLIYPSIIGYIEALLKVIEFIIFLKIPNQEILDQQ